jgi:hypothetical protein
MKKKAIRALIALIVLALIAAPAPAQTKSSLTEALDKMLENHWQPNVQAALGSFTYAYTDLPSSFSRYMEDELAAAIASSKRLALFNKGASVAMDADFRDAYKDFFKDNMVGALITGKYFEEANNIKVRIEMTDLTNGNLIGVTDFYETKKALPKGVTVKPDKKAQDMRQSLTAVVTAPVPSPSPKASAQPSPATGALSVSVSTDRGKGGSYVDGEFMQLFVTVNKDAYVKVYHIDVDGKVVLIYPNYLSKDVKLLPAGTVITMGTLSDGFRFKLGAPYGTEFIKVIASTTPFAFTEKDFKDLGAQAASAIKGAAGAEQGGEMAEALASYVINPK